MEWLPVVKPAYGETCNGCGLCCRTEICRVGLAMNPAAHAPCEFLTQHDGRYWCGLVERMEGTELAGVMKFVMGIGIGCDAEEVTHRHRSV